MRNRPKQLRRSQVHTKVLGAEGGMTLGTAGLFSIPLSGSGCFGNTEGRGLGSTIVSVIDEVDVNCAWLKVV